MLFKKIAKVESSPRAQNKKKLIAVKKRRIREKNGGHPKRLMFYVQYNCQAKHHFEN